MEEAFPRIPEPRPPASDRMVRTVRGQLHRFVLIPLMLKHTTWFDAGPISIGVERRALGETAERMVRGPSIHVCSADHHTEYLRFDVFGSVLHYHYVLNAEDHNLLWGYDPVANGPMIPWVCHALEDRLPTLLRGAGADALAAVVEQQGWDASVLPAVARAASDCLAPRGDDLERAKEGMEWMRRWKAVHPQFNTVEGDEI